MCTVLFDDIRKNIVMKFDIYVFIKYFEKKSLPPVFSRVRVTRCFALCVMFSRSLFILLFVFLRPLYFLSFFYLRILITPLVSLSLAIVMSVPLRLTDSDYSFSIFKLGHCDVCPS